MQHLPSDPIAEEFTADDKAELEALVAEGFERWNKRSLQGLIRGMSDYGREEWDKIRESIQHATTIDYSEEEIKEYAAVFWQRYKELEGE